jgi:hypothetical protein
MLKSRRIMWAGHLARLGKTKNTWKVLVRISEVKDCVEDLGMYGRIILKLILKNRMGGC